MAEPQQNESDQPEEDLELDLSQPADDGLSLDDLSAAYARLIEGDDLRKDSDSSIEEDVAPEGEEEDADLPDDDAGDVDPRSILEAMLFVGDPNNEPLTSKQIARRMRGVTPAEIDALITELNAVYAEQACPYQIASRGAGYALQLRNEFAGLRDRFYGRVREARLSQAAIDVLAMVAYRQPMSRKEVTDLRGKPSGGVLSQLVRRQLLRIERREDKPRDPHYYTTNRFLELFGLASIEELPQSQEFEKGA